MALSPEMITALRMRIATTRGHKIRVRKAPRWLHPDSITREYARTLVAIVDTIQELTERMFIPYIARLEADALATRPSASVRADAIGGDVDDLINNLKHQVDGKIGTGRVLASEIGRRTGAFNDKQWKKIIKRMLGVDLFTVNPWLPGMIEIFTSENAALITSLKGKAIEDVRQMTLRGIQQGTRHEVISKQIQERFDVSRSRARLIARDQVSKLNGQITEFRQTEIGIDSYIWQDSADERVRQTHAAHDGRRIKWAEPPFDTGHPGQDYQCRCWAEPYLKDVIGADFSEDEVSFN